MCAFHPSRPVDLPTQLPGTILFYVLGAVSATGGTREFPKRPAPSSQAVLFKGASLMPSLSERL